MTKKDKGNTYKTKSRAGRKGGNKGNRKKGELQGFRIVN